MDDETDKAVEAAEDTAGLVTMTKDGEMLHVHPSTVHAHKLVGWRPV